MFSTVTALHEHEKSTQSYDVYNIWHCMQRAIDEKEECGYSFSTEKEFIAHRRDRHNDRYVDSDVFALGPAVGKQFWCGFCR
jgi:hypothetical protein